MWIQNDILKRSIIAVEIVKMETKKKTSKHRYGPERKKISFLTKKKKKILIKIDECTNY